jgi:hypothetical protein
MWSFWKSFIEDYYYKWAFSWYFLIFTFFILLIESFYQKTGLDSMDVKALRKMIKNKKLVQKHRAFLALETIMKQIPCIIGPGNKAGKLLASQVFL